MTPHDFRNSLGKGHWGQKTHFTAGLIATTQLIPLGCMSQWQGGISACKRVWLSKTQRRWQFVVAGHHRGQGLACLSTVGAWPESGQGEGTSGKEKKSSCLELGSMHTTQTLAETPSHLPPTGSSASRELQAGCRVSGLECGAKLRADAWPEEGH